MMRLCWLWLLGSSLLFSVETEEEALFLRRIVDFWQEGEYQIAKSQMEEFILQFPESNYADTLSAALGDLCLREKNFSAALNHYSQIQSPEFLDRVFLNRMQCLYEMQWYANLADECEAYLAKSPNLHVTYFLAIALYHQCLNASKDPAALQALAARAKPYFETLSQSELSHEIAQGFAHLCCILKDYPKAAQIYLDLAKASPESEEEMLFQAALIQAEYDKEQAIQSFAHLTKEGKKRSKEAAYNQLVLSFDTGRELHVEWSDFPPEKVGMAHLLVGRSLLNAKKYPEAIIELKAYLQDASPSDSCHAAILSLLEAAYQCNDLPTLDLGVAQLNTHYPQDKDLPKVYFSRAQNLKKTQKNQAARTQIEQLLDQFPHFEQRPQALFELAHLDYQAQAWGTCYKKSHEFLSQFSQHELAPFAWRYLAASSTELAAENASFKEQLASDLETLLTQPLPEPEKREWQFLLAKTQYELHRYKSAVQLLQDNTSANGQLLLALCYRDGYDNLEQFCQLAEASLDKGENLAEPSAIHVSLFNAFLQLGKIEQAADHLFAAFEAKANIKTDNLLWLADSYFNRLQVEDANFALANRTALILEKLQRKPDAQCKAALHYKLAKVYSLLGRLDEEITLLEKMDAPTAESQLLLAEGYMKKGIVTKAALLFDEIVTSSATVRSAASASAALQGARLKRAAQNPDLTEVATLLKNLVIQKTFMNEPIHLEAALDYVDLQAQADPLKKIALLQKTKADFERSDDLLSKDYHEARAQHPARDGIYQGYMQLIDATILAAQAQLESEPEQQKTLQAKSKDLLLKIINEPISNALIDRAQMLLNETT
jgi:TolA-binding protein